LRTGDLSDAEWAVPAFGTAREAGWPPAEAFAARDHRRACVRVGGVPPFAV